MKHRKETEEEFSYVLKSTPLAVYNMDESAYPWPNKHCTFCITGKLKHISGTNILVCKKCKGEFHIPHVA